MAILAQHEDADVERFLKLYTFMPLDEIAKLAALGGAEINEAKKRLATEATTLVHGLDKARRAEETARQTFEEGTLAESLPTIDIAGLSQGVGILTAFVQAGLVSSTSEARRQIRGGGLRVNDVAISDERAVLGPADLTIQGVVKLSLGRKRHILAKPA